MKEQKKLGEERKLQKKQDDKAGKHNLGVRPSVLPLTSAYSPPWWTAIIEYLLQKKKQI